MKVGQPVSDTRKKIISAAITAVRQYGLEGVRIQNISDLAEITPGAVYRHFKGKDELLIECFTYVDKQAADIFNHIKFNPLTIISNPAKAIRKLWQPYFRFWINHPDETVFYHRFRDSAFFHEFDKTRDASYFGSFVKMVKMFRSIFPGLVEINQDMLWLHVLTVTVLYAKYVVEGVLPDNGNTEDTVFRLMMNGLDGYLRTTKKTKRKF